MREVDETYKEWLACNDECGGETTAGDANRKTTKKKEKKEKQTAGI